MNSNQNLNMNYTNDATNYTMPQRDTSNDPSAEEKAAMAERFLDSLENPFALDSLHSAESDDRVSKVNAAIAKHDSDIPKPISHAATGALGLAELLGALGELAKKVEDE